MIIKNELKKLILWILILSSTITVGASEIPLDRAMVDSFSSAHPVSFSGLPHQGELDSEPIRITPDSIFLPFNVITHPISKASEAQKYIPSEPGSPISIFFLRKTENIIPKALRFNQYAAVRILTLPHALSSQDFSEVWRLLGHGEAFHVLAHLDISGDPLPSEFYASSKHNHRDTQSHRSCWSLSSLPYWVALTIQGRELFNTEAWSKRCRNFGLAPPQDDKNNGFLIMGYAYETGFKMPEERDFSLFFYNKACDDPRAKFLIGQGYDAWSGVSSETVKDDLTALRYYQEAADSGCQAALTQIALMTHYGRCKQPPNYAKAANLYRQAAEGGDAQAQALLGTFYQNSLGGVPYDLEKAQYFYELSSEQQHPLGQAYYGMLHAHKGIKRTLLCVPKLDVSDLIHRACLGFKDLKDVVSQDTLGFLYEMAYGKLPSGTEVEYQAYRLYAQAADREYGPALYNLYRMHRDQRVANLGTQKSAHLSSESQADIQDYLTYIQIADRAYAPAHYMLYRMYRDQLTHNFNPFQGGFFCFRAAEAGSLEAQYALAGHIKQHDYGMTATHEIDARNWYKRAAQQGLAKAKTQLAHMYKQGQGTPMNLDKAQALYDEAALQGDDHALYCSKINFLESQGLQGPLEPVFEAYLKTAGQGDPVFQTLVALMYSKGWGTQVDMRKAAHWYRAAAQQDFVVAQSNLATLYCQGEGVRQRLNRSVRWFKRAAQQDYAPARYHLSLLHFRGMEVPQDPTLAFMYARQAAIDGFAPAQVLVAQAYLEGVGVSQDDAQSIRWLYLAADQHHAIAQYSLGILCKQGRGVPENDAEAVGWLIAAARQDYAPAYYQMGVMTLLGRGVEANVHHAFCWFRWAAALNDPKIKEQLSWLFQKNLSLIDREGRAHPVISHEGTLYLRAMGRDLKGQVIRSAPKNTLSYPGRLAVYIAEKSGKLYSFTHEALPIELHGILVRGDPVRTYIQKSVESIIPIMNEPIERIIASLHGQLMNLGIQETVLTLTQTLRRLKKIPHRYQKTALFKAVTTWLNRSIMGKDLCERILPSQRNSPKAPLKRMGNMLVSPSWYDPLYHLAQDILLTLSKRQEETHIVSASAAGHYGQAGNLITMGGIGLVRRFMKEAERFPPLDRFDYIKERLVHLAYESQDCEVASPLARALNPEFFPS